MYSIKIDSLNCMSCVHNIDDALKEADSKVEVKADVKNRTILVQSTQSADELKKVIEKAGYPVSSITPYSAKA